MVDRLHSQICEYIYHMHEPIALDLDPSSSRYGLGAQVGAAQLDSGIYAEFEELIHDYHDQ